MVISNTLWVDVASPVPPEPTIGKPTISVGKTSVKVNEPLTVYLSVPFDKPITADQSQYYVLVVDVYVNGNVVNTMRYRIGSGITVFKSSFTLTFQEPGKYEIYVDVRIEPAKEIPTPTPV